MKLSIEDFTELQECLGILVSDDEYGRNCRFVTDNEVWKFFNPETGRSAIGGFYCWAVPVTTTEEWARGWAAKQAAHAADLRRICGEAPYETEGP